jgi:NAD(P)-dependent dehydrogenase (short-subunit alcohol dehydrogenase family)
MARQLAKMNFYVVLGCRDEERGQAAGERLRREQLDGAAIPLDITDERTIASASDWVRENGGALDVLINNAGVNLQRAPASQTDMSLLRATYETNFFGVVALTKAMLPALLKAPAGRIVNVSSTLGSLTLQSDARGEFGGMKWLTYCSSKAAVVGQFELTHYQSGTQCGYRLLRLGTHPHSGKDQFRTQGTVRQT